MRNLTSSTSVLLPAGGAAPIVLPPSPAVTTKQMQEMLILKGKIIDVGAGAMEQDHPEDARTSQDHPRSTAPWKRRSQRTRPPAEATGLVLIRKDLLRYVQPKLARHIAAPHPDAGPNTEDQPRITTSMLIRPPSLPNRESRSSGCRQTERAHAIREHPT